MIMLKFVLCFILLFSSATFAEDEAEYMLQGDIETAIQQKIEQEVSSEMDEVKMWMRLLNAVEQEYIDIESYPSELSKYMQHQMIIIDEYLKLVEDAEVQYYEGGDYKKTVALAQRKLKALKVLRYIFDDYVKYKNNEKSQTRLKLSEDAIRNNKAVPLMHRSAYTVMRGEYPIKIERDRKLHSRLKSVETTTFIYRNGDRVVFKGDRLIEVKSSR